MNRVYRIRERADVLRDGFPYRLKIYDKQLRVSSVGHQCCQGCSARMDQKFGQNRKKKIRPIHIGIIRLGSPQYLNLSNLSLTIILSGNYEL